MLPCDTLHASSYLKNLNSPSSLEFGDRWNGAQWLYIANERKRVRPIRCVNRGQWEYSRVKGQPVILLIDYLPGQEWETHAIPRAQNDCICDQGAATAQRHTLFCERVDCISHNF